MSKLSLKPLLAGKVKNVNTLRYPLVASPKIDGVRCLILQDDNGMKTSRPFSRKLEHIPNRHIFKMLSGMPVGYDGELVLPDKPFNEVSGAIMSEDGVPSFVYVVFDMYHPTMPYIERLQSLFNVEKDFPVYMKVIESKVIESAEQLLEYETDCLKRGYEGVMVRSMAGRYKQGRSTTNEGILLKLKRMEDAEAIIIGAEEEKHNANKATKDKLGHTKRSSHKANKEGKGTLGALICRRADGVEFKVGTGFTAEQRELYWRGFDMLKGRIVKYRFQPTGVKEKPRFPSFLGFRDERDM